MVDYDTLLSPGGGSAYGERMMGSGLLAGAGIGLVQSKITSREFRTSALRRLGTPDLKSDSKYVRAGVRGKRGPGISIVDRMNVKADLIRNYRESNQAMYGRAIGNRRIGFNDNALKAVEQKVAFHTQLRSKEINAFKSKVSRTSAGIAAHGSRLKALGWASSIFDAFYMSSYFLAPGVSTSAKAQASDTQAMLQPLQSSALMTQRQRSMQAIHDSQLAISPILGNEAAYMHR